MWDGLMWRQLRNPEIAGDVAALRQDSLRFFNRLTAIGYLLWHFTTLLVIATRGAQLEDQLRYWALFPIVIAGVLVTHRLEQRHPDLAAACFLASSVVSITVATWLLSSSAVILLLPLLAVAAVVLFHPLAGLLVSLGSGGLVVILWHFGPLAFLSRDQLIQLSVGTILAVAVSWTLGRTLVIAVEWTLGSYAQALKNAREAQSHRAELARALKQLDHAYYRLERANAALELAWKAAEVAERSKSEFVTNISHELRTPLNLIVGFSEMIVTSPEGYGAVLPVQFRGDLHAIYRSAQHLLALTDDVLDLARIGMGHLALTREPVDLDRIIADACNLVREYIEAKGLRLHVELQEDLPWMTLDRLRIRQVLLNLLINAAHFTDRGSISVIASTEESRVIVKVIDTGRGIAPESLPRVFDEFYHADSDGADEQTRIGGFGLGLPLSKRFVELHGGTIGVESAIGFGTTFWLTLPTSRGAGVPQDEAWPPLWPVRASGTAERVLVLVSSEGRLTSFLQRHLRGYHVIAAPDLCKAFSVAIEFRSVAILLDVDSDDRVADQDAPVPIVRLPLPHPERIAATLGAFGYLIKPVTRGDLQDAIARLGRPVRTVLIVDDDERFIRLMKRFLHSIDPQGEREILSASSGGEALAVMDETKPDLLLLDLAMPEIDGRDVLGAMAANPHLADVPVLIISAKEPSDDRLRLKGPLSLVKPEGLLLEELLGAIDSLLRSLDPPRQYLTSRP